MIARKLCCSGAAILALLGGAAALAQSSGAGPAPSFPPAAPVSPEASARGFGAYKPAQPYAEQIVTSFYLPMRDGTRIAVSLHRPARNGEPVEGKFPVVWHHTLDIQGPGARGGPVGPETRDLTQLTYNGYVVAVVARRGAGASFGVRRGYEDLTEAYDGYEVNEWLAAQPWSTGAVGMYGCSNTGEAVMHVITARPPHLKAAFAGCFSFNRYDGFARGGILANWGTGPTRSIEEDMSAVPVQGDESKTLLRQAVEEHQASTPLFDLMKSMPFRDSFSSMVMSRFWAEASPSSFLDQMRQADVPLYIQAGWHDDFRREGLVAFDNWAPGKRWIVVGPWTHCSNAGFDLRGEQLRFFDYWLKGIDTGLTRDDPIHYYTEGAKPERAWRSSPTWPIAKAREERLYLGKDGLTSAPGVTAQASLTADFKPGCAGPTGGNPTVLQPCHPQRGAASWAMAPLKTDMEVTGHPLLDVWVASSTPEANLFAYLEDVAPDGTITALTDARQQLSTRKEQTPAWRNLGLSWHRAFAEDHEPLKFGEPVRLRVDFLPVSYVFKAGHRIQVTVAATDYRERARNQPAQPPVLTIVSDAQRRSSLSLPAVN